MRRALVVASILVVGVVVLLLPLRHTANAGIISRVRAEIATGDLDRAQALLDRYRRTNGDSPDTIEAVSWLARAALARHDLDRADRYTAQVYRYADAALKRRPLDAEPHLPIALGAAIEVDAQASAESGDRSAAVGYLTQQLARYRATSIAPRIQKNLNLLTLVGKPMPALTARETLGPPMPPMEGQPALLFFWAHWCPDCKAMAPIVAALESAHRKDGLLVIGPTQRYGYVQSGRPASPSDELAHIDEVRRQYYGAIAGMPVPVSNEDFQRYGVSTTPTLVLVNRAGIVTMYHPGRMTRDELEAMIRKTLDTTVQAGE